MREVGPGAAEREGWGRAAEKPQARRELDRWERGLRCSKSEKGFPYPQPHQPGAGAETSVNVQTQLTYIPIQ